MLIRKPRLSCQTSTAGHHRIDFGHIRLVIENKPAQFHPGVREERQLLDADNHFGGKSIFLEQARCGCRTLQAQSWFEIERRSKINRVANILSAGSWEGQGSHRCVSNLLVDCAKIPSDQEIFKTEQLPICTRNHFHKFFSVKERILTLRGWP